MSYLLQILIARRQCWNVIIKVHYIKSVWLGPSWLFLRLLGGGSGFLPAILVWDLADWPKNDLAVACATLILSLPNLWNLVGVMQGVDYTRPESSHLLCIASSLIKEFDWGFFHFFLVLTMKFLSFSDSFFIVKKITKMQFFQHSVSTTDSIIPIFTRLESSRNSLSNELFKQVVTVGNFRVIWLALSAHQY